MILPAAWSEACCSDSQQRHQASCGCPKGRILMTHPTKAIVGMLLRDFIAVSRGGVDEGLYTAPDLQARCWTLTRVLPAAPLS